MRRIGAAKKRAGGARKPTGPIMAIYLSLPVLVLWAIPAVYAVQSGSVRAMAEVAILLAVALILPFVQNLVATELYGVAASVSLGDAMILMCLQLLLWLAALGIGLAAQIRGLVESTIRRLLDALRSGLTGAP